MQTWIDFIKCILLVNRILTSKNCTVNTEYSIYIFLSGVTFKSTKLHSNLIVTSTLIFNLPELLQLIDTGRYTPDTLLHWLDLMLLHLEE